MRLQDHERQDSAGRPIEIGSRVRFRGEEYTIKKFRPGLGRFRSAQIEFEEECHTDEIPDEIGVDFIGPSPSSGL